jgi:hypothetical protein
MMSENNLKSKLFCAIPIIFNIVCVRIQNSAFF